MRIDMRRNALRLLRPTQTGTVKGALGGAFSGGLFAGVGNLELSGIKQVGAHALAGGVSSVAQGGDFKSGFLSGGFAEFAGPYTQGWGDVGNGVARMVVGGTAAVLGGGKFENGAATAAFAYLFNHAMHDERGGYRENRTLEGRVYSVRFSTHCADSQCLIKEYNLDPTDPGSAAYLKALNVKGMHDIQDTGSAVVGITPVGRVGVYAGRVVMGAAAGELAYTGNPDSLIANSVGGRVAHYLRGWGISQSIATRVGETVSYVLGEAKN